MYSNTMPSGYATDSSTESNKRVRLADDVDASDASGGARKSPPFASSTPLEMARTACKQASLSLHPSMRNRVLDHALLNVQAYATYFHQKKKIQEAKDNPDKIMTEVKIQLKVQPLDRVVNGQRFKDRAATTAGVIAQCQKLLHQEGMWYKELNLLGHHEEFQEVLARALPELAELVLAENNMAADCSGHRTVVNYVIRHRDDFLPTLRMTAEDFEALYLRVHSLEQLPDPNPPRQAPLQAIPPASPGAPGLAGGGGANNGGGTSNGPHAAGAPTPAATAGTTPQPGAEQQQAVAELVALANAANLTADQQTAVNGMNAASLEAIYAMVTAARRGASSNAPVGQQQRRPTPAVTPRPDPSRREEGKAEEQADDNQAESMEEEAIGFGTQTTGNILFDYGPDGQGYSSSPGRPGAPAPTPAPAPSPTPAAAPAAAAPAPAAPAAAPAVVDPRFTKVYDRLRTIVKQLFVRPIGIYNNQAEANATTIRIKKVATQQTLRSKADKVTEILEKEATVTPKALQIVVQQSVIPAAKAAAKKAVEEATQPKKKKQQQKKQQEKQKQQQTPRQEQIRHGRGPGASKGRGGAGRGRGTRAPAQKTNQQQKQRGRSQQSNAGSHVAGADGSGNGGRQGRSNSREQRSKSRSKRRSGASRSRKSKSPSTPKRK